MEIEVQSTQSFDGGRFLWLQMCHSHVRVTARVLECDPQKVCVEHAIVAQCLSQDFGPPPLHSKQFDSILESVGNKYEDLSQEQQLECKKLMYAADNVLHGRKLQQIIQDNQHRRLIAASNSLQTNFKVPNGFLVCNGCVVHKTVRGIDQRLYTPLKGLYSAFVLEGSTQGIQQLHILNNSLQTKGIRSAISGAPIVMNGKICPVKGRNSAQFQPAMHDEVNWDPETTRAAFSAIGSTKDDHIILVHAVPKDGDAPLVKEFSELCIGTLCRIIICDASVKVNSSCFTV